MAGTIPIDRYHQLMVDAGFPRPGDTIAALLKRWRVAAGLSQEDLADRAGVSAKAISAIERGARRRPHPRTLRALASGLGLDAGQRALLLTLAAREPDAAVSQLPRDIPDFSGREAELARAEAILDGSRVAPVLLVTGQPGVGKSAVAVHLAHRLGARFPDGQLFVNLQGATAGLVPLDPLEALGRMLRALGWDPSDVPDQVEEAAARFRSAASRRRLLILLDDARSAAQVRPLLPGSSSCAVLVTSRQALTTLEGARALRLDVPPRGDAHDLLTRIVGSERVAAEPDAAWEVVDRCARLPLAIRIAGARLAARPSWPLGELAEHLADAGRRLEVLQAGDLAVRASFDVSLQALQASADPADRAAADAFGLLSLPDGPDLGADVAAGLLYRPRPDADLLLGRLVDAQLLEAPGPGRYRLHDLVRLYGRAYAERRHPEPERLAAIARVAGFYTATAWRVMALLYPADPRLATADPRWTGGGVELADAPSALDWLEAELPNVLAAIAQAARAAPELPGQLARALAGFFRRRGHWRSWVQASEVALELGVRAGDRVGEAYARADLGAAHRLLGHHRESIALLRQSIALFAELGDGRAQSLALSGLAGSHAALGQRAEATRHARESLDIVRRLGDQRGQARSLEALARVLEPGSVGEAVACLQESLAILQALGDREGMATCLGQLGVIGGHLGRYEEAIANLRECLAICEELGYREGQAETLRALGMVYERQQCHMEAIGCLRESIALFRELGGRRSLAIALRDLGDALGAAADHDGAREAWREALAVCEALQLPQVAQLRERLA